MNDELITHEPSKHINFSVASIIETQNASSDSNDVLRLKCEFASGAESNLWSSNEGERSNKTIAKTWTYQNAQNIWRQHTETDYLQIC